MKSSPSNIFLSRLYSICDSYRLLILFCSFLAAIPGVSQIVVPEGHYKVETHSNPVIICNVMPTGISGPVSTITLGGTTFDFDPVVPSIERNREYKVTNGGISYRLFFSVVAIVDVAVNTGFNNINNSTEVDAVMTVADTTGPLYTSTMGIRHRGASSLSYPKKSYRVQLKDGNGYKHESIFGLRTDRRWLMLALYNERLRINNKVCHDLWLDMHKLYYLNEQPEALSTIRSRYVLVFIDNVYRGVYLFTEDVDAKQYKLVQDNVNKNDVFYENNQRLYTGGELYKSEAPGPPHEFVENVPPLPSVGSEAWALWEIKHPSVSDWKSLRDFSVWVRDNRNNNAQIQAGVWNYIHKGNLIDYFLYINLVYAEDNLSKNMFIAKYRQGEPYFYGVWDLDGTLGYEYHSGRNPRGGGLIGNFFWDRFVYNNPSFQDEIAVRWFTLRRGLLSAENILNRIQKQYDYLNNNGVYALESIVQQRTPTNAVDGGWDRSWFNYSSAELNYMKGFMATRLQTMDQLIQPWLISALPVTISSFTVSAEKTLVNLRWETSSEKNADRFEAEHSLDGVKWNTVGKVSASGASEKLQVYTFNHDPGQSGVHYYRLKMIDRDGSFGRSEIKSIRLSRDHTVSVYPNPAKERLHIIPEGSVKLSRVTLSDLVGRVVSDVKLKGADPETSLEVRNLEGLFILRTEFEDGSVKVQKVLVE